MNILLSGLKAAEFHLQATFSTAKTNLTFEYGGKHAENITVSAVSPLMHGV